MNVKKIDLMHKMFGIGSEKCGTCNHLKTHSANRVWFKCEVYGDTSSEATDWRNRICLADYSTSHTTEDRSSRSKSTFRRLTVMRSRLRGRCRYSIWKITKEMEHGTHSEHSIRL